MFETILAVVKGAAPFLLDLVKDGGSAILTPQGAGVTLGVAVLAYVQERFDNNQVKAVITAPFRALGFALYKLLFAFGVTVTAGASKWSITKGLWNKYIEPFVIDLLDIVFNGLIDGVEIVLDKIRDGLFAGLRSDNE